MLRSVLLIAACLAAVSCTELTKGNYEELSAGKTAFIKFFAPWCGHCKSMKPAWDKLMGEFKGHKDVLIGDCDCTGDCKSLCEEIGVQGYPTIKHGDPAALEDYQGGRDYDSLKKHAETNLKPSCSPSNIDLCDAAKKAEIEKLQGMSASDLDSEITKKEGEIAAAESKFKAEVEKLQATYKALQETKEEAIKTVKESGLGLMKAVKAANKKK